MADYDFEPPSFSLGIEFDIESPSQITPMTNRIPQPAKPPLTAPNLRQIEEEDDDDFISLARVSEPPRVLKRLRRLTTARPPPKEPKVEYEDQRCNVDDDIEDFSDEDCFRAGTLPTNSVCSSSKPSLQGKKVVTSDSGTQWISRKGKEILSPLASINVDTRGSNIKFPKLTSSPLRRFQLIDSDSDSDSDNPSTIEDMHKEVPSVILSPEEKRSDFCKETTLGNQGTKTSVGKQQIEDLWEDFDPNKSSSIPTPAFDKFCEEYFTDLKNKSMPKSDCKQTDCDQHTDKTSRLPALFYFFHNDSRIQKLVRERLPHFFPLELANNQEDTQDNISVIDYMGQFAGEQNSRQTNRRQNAEKNIKRSKKTKTSLVDGVSDPSENWINPKSCAGVQKNAKGRKVQADSGASGRWYTGQDGRRVYVAKNGQELNGQTAYRQYRKDSGMSRNSKKNAAANKKTASRNRVPKK